ncbi:hypothetical protein ACFLU6_07100 [Acidobacteriota bacterium]
MNREGAEKAGAEATDHRWWWPAGVGWVLVASVVLTFVMAAPVLRHPKTYLFGSEIVGRHHDPYTVVRQFEDPQALRLHTQPATDYAGAVIARIFGGVPAYNIMVLATFPLAAFFTYLLGHRLTGSFAASSVAALVYAFAPYHVAHAAYHPHIAQTQWLPLYFLALWLCLQRAGVKRLLVLLATGALVVFSNFYYGFIIMVLTPFAVIAAWLVRPPGVTKRKPRNLFITAGVLAGAFCGGLIYIHRFAGSVLTHPEKLAFPREDLFLYCARWWSYFLPPVEHPIAGDWVAGIWERHGIGGGLLEQQISLGIGIFILSVFSLALWLAGRRDGGFRNIPNLVIIASIAFLCSLSPDRQIGSITIIRPSGILYEFLPMFRAYARFSLVVLLMASLLAGMGAARLLRWRRNYGGAVVAAGLLALVVLELTPFPPWRARDVLPTKAHRWIDSLPPTARVLDCVPYSNSGERTALRYLKKKLTLLGGRCQDCGEPGIGGKLASLGYTHMLVRGDSPLGAWLTQQPSPQGLKRRRIFEDSIVFEVVAEPPPLFVREISGFHWREYLGARTYRWMGEHGTINAYNRTEHPLNASLELVLAAFPEPRHLKVSLNGRAAGQLDVDKEPSTFHLGPFRLKPGSNMLRLSPLKPPVTADKVLRNGDLRAITVALWEWRWTTDPVLDTPSP